PEQRPPTQHQRPPTQYQYPQGFDQRPPHFPTNPPPPMNVGYPYIPPQPKKDNSNLVIYGVIGVVVLLAIIVFFMVLAGSN
ncbi:MAG: hypothetical protein CUN52_10215, partial [Phototrophicales bacterium]